jgi:nitrite reductase/ring-hydroxylating ferredoxin subunit
MPGAGKLDRICPGKEDDVDWIEVLRDEQLADSQRRVVSVEGRPILLLRHEGNIYAVDNACPHMGAALESGEVTEDATIVCPRHHSAFDLRTGEVKAWTPWPPGVGRLLGSVAKEKALRVYPTRVERGSIWVGVEESD